MKKNLHPTSQKVHFSCSSCKKEFSDIWSTLKTDNVQIEICSGCHPFYLGKSTAGKISGKAEKLIHKFEAGKNNMENPVSKKPTKEKRVKKTQSLSSLEVK